MTAVPQVTEMPTAGSIHPESPIGRAHGWLEDARARYQEAISPAKDLERQAAALRAEVTQLETQAGDLSAPLDAEIRLAATQRRLERIEAERRRILEAAVPLRTALERAQAQHDDLQRQYQEAQRGLDVLHDWSRIETRALTIGQWEALIERNKERIRQLTAAPEEGTNNDRD